MANDLLRQRSMRKILGSLLVVALAAGCSASSSSSSDAQFTANAGNEGPGKGGSPPSDGSLGGSGGGTGASAGATGTGSGSGGSDGGAALPPAGTLTAGAWDDNLNFDFFSSYALTKTTLTGAPPFSSTERSAANAFFLQTPTSHASLDLALMIDTTGSMGDEIAYLQSEFDSIATSISAKFPGVTQRWALVVYRDENQGDAYTTQTFDFGTDLKGYEANLNAQSAAGGGDYPEAVDRGLDAASKLSWSTDTSSRLLFWVADAPGHDDKGQAIHDAVMANKAKGVHVYPVSASGTDDLLELTMRSTAQATGGRYLFLTDDSGVGDPHKIPEIPCFFVTKLNTAVVRMVSNELTGTYAGPDASEIIRVGGDPHDRQCSLGDDAGVVQIF